MKDQIDRSSNEIPGDIRSSFWTLYLWPVIDTAGANLKADPLSVST